MWAFGFLTAFMLFALAIVAAYIRRDEIMANWSKYRADPLYMFAAPMFKPDDDPRSRLAFGLDNFVSVVTALIMKVFSVFLQPILKIFQGMTGSLEETANGIMNMRGIFSNMFKKFNDVTNLFQRRFNTTLHSLRVTWIKLRESINKTFGVAVSTLYAGVSVFRVIDNMFRLMTIVSIAILSILLGFVVFFFFILWPILPIIIIALHFIAQTPYAGEVTGMEGAFCFNKNTLIKTATGSKPIQEITIDTVLHNNSKVVGTLKFDGNYEPLYDLYGIQVSGTHIYYDNNIPIFVKDHKDAVKGYVSTREVYCLLTSDHKIPVLNNNRIYLFADWEEIDDIHDLESWNKLVFTILNPDISYQKPSSINLESEAALSAETLVCTPHGRVPVKSLAPGAIVIDTNGAPTHVTGVVNLDASQIAGVRQYNAHTFVSSGAWVRMNNIWSMESAVHKTPQSTWHMLFTESGTFRISVNNNLVDLRDFSDVGSQHISKTYTSVLQMLKS